MVLDRIVDEGEYAPPEPTDDLQLAQELCLEYIQRYRLLGLEDERLDMLRAFNAQVGGMLDMIAPAMPASGAMAALPEAAPTSDLLPNMPAGPGALQ